MTGVKRIELLVFIGRNRLLRNMKSVCPFSLTENAAESMQRAELRQLVNIEPEKAHTSKSSFRILESLWQITYHYK